MADSLQQIIQQMLTSVQSMINSPGNAYYLPTWIQTNGYDPYGQKNGMYWSVQLTDPSIIAAAANICPTIDITSSPCPGVDSYIGSNQPPTLVLGTNQPGGLIVTGGSNAYMASMSCNPSDPYSITAVVNLSTLGGMASNVVISGQFNFTQYCCCSADGSNCDEGQPPQPQVGTGTFTATIAGTPIITIGFRITNLAPNVLTIGVQSANLQVPINPQNNLPNITITVDIQSIPTGANRDSYNNLAMNAFNSPTGLNNISQQINSVMGDPTQLGFLGNVLTGVIDGYLKDTHQYPFDGS